MKTYTIVTDNRESYELGLLAHRFGAVLEFEGYKEDGNGSFNAVYTLTAEHDLDKLLDMISSVVSYVEDGDEAS